MKPKYFVHMGPRPAEKVSYIWKATHVSVFLLILASSGVATICIYNILEMYQFHCIIYAKLSFEQTYSERVKEINKTAHEMDQLQNHTQATITTANTNATEVEARRGFVDVDCELDPNAAGCAGVNKMGAPYWREDYGIGSDEERLFLEDRTGFLNMRKTIFSSIYMCDLLLFAPLSSMVVSIFLGGLLIVGGKGGAGDPGDLFPNPWICVYPFLAICCFMMIFSFVTDSIFHNGFGQFCLSYFNYTGDKTCTELLDQYNVQFSVSKEAQPFYMNYHIGSYGVQATSALWTIQMVVYVLRILCLADFSLYLTKIKMKEDDKHLASVVEKVMTGKSK